MHIKTTQENKTTAKLGGSGSDFRMCEYKDDSGEQEQAQQEEHRKDDDARGHRDIGERRADKLYFGGRVPLASPSDLPQTTLVRSLS